MRGAGVTAFMEMFEGVATGVKRVLEFPTYVSWGCVEDPPRFCWSLAMVAISDLQASITELIVNSSWGILSMTFRNSFQTVFLIFSKSFLQEESQAEHCWFLWRGRRCRIHNQLYPMFLAWLFPIGPPADRRTRVPRNKILTKKDCLPWSLCQHLDSETCSGQEHPAPS